MLRHVVAVGVATLWSVFCEFFRNELLFKHIWLDHFQQLGLNFPSSPLNGAIWGLWSLGFVLGLKFILTKFSLLPAVGLAWLYGFVLMWVATGNLGVLPLSLLAYAVPWSMLETYGAGWLLVKLSKQTEDGSRA